MKPLPRLLVVAALIAAFIVTARGGFSLSSQDSGIATPCELDPPQEIEALEHCLAINPRDVEVMLDLGSLYESAGRVDRAEDLYRLGLSVDAKDGDLHVRLGRLLLRSGQAPAAAVEARTALTLQPRSSRAVDLLEQAAQAGGR